MVIDIVKTVIVGICACMPPGPILILVLGKCMRKGRNSGFITALGSVTVDMFYTVVALFALKYFQDFMDHFEKEVLLGGGALLIVVGLFMAFNSRKKKMRRQKNESAGAGDYFQAIGMGFSNVGAVAMIFALLAMFNVADGTPRDWHMIPIVAAEVFGEVLYWFCFTHYASKLKGKFSLDKMSVINIFMGVAISVFGVVLIVKSLMLYLC